MKQVINAVPNIRLSAKGLRRRQNIIIGSVIFAALMGPLALFVASGSSAPTNAIEASVKTIAFAEMIAEDFLSGEGTPLPAAKDVDRFFGREDIREVNSFSYDSLTFRSTEIDFIDGRRVDTINFNVESSDGVFFRLAVPVTFSDAGRQLLASSPSMFPATFASNASAPSPVPASAVTDVPANVEERVALWADAYARDDSQDLRVIVNDADAPAGGSYLGLGGFTCQEGCSEVLWGYTAPQDNSLSIARVKVLFTSASANEFTMSNEFDLLIRGWSSDAPRILAWGSAGTGAGLTPYINNTAL